MPRDRNAPWQLANLDAFNYLQIGHIDDGNVIRYSVSGQKIFLVRRKRSVPNALSNEKIFLHRRPARELVAAMTVCVSALVSMPAIKLGKLRMVWTTPTLVEICIGLEINGYQPAEF